MVPNNIKYARKFRNFLININYDLFEITKRINGIQIVEDYDTIHYYVMSLEDRRFLRHCGFDILSIIRECKNYLFRKKCGGASTIDMQMVRTITGFKERTAYRKIYETLLAFIVNFKFSKKEIIDCYLANAFFGSQMYGIEAAISKYFNKNYIDELNDLEKAMLAAMLQRPKPLNPSPEWEIKVLARAEYAQFIRRRMNDGYQ